MILFKTSAETLAKVLENQKHATQSMPANWKHGDIILIAQTKKSLPKNEKCIRYIMKLRNIYEDKKGESKAIWDGNWKYIVEGYDLQCIEPFNIEDIQVSSHDYSPVVTHCNLETKDENAVLNWINSDLITPTNPSMMDYKLMYDDMSVEELDKAFSEAPRYIEKVVSFLHRPSRMRNAIIKQKGTRCEICNKEGFRKKNSDELYCEVHHMIELNNRAPRTFQSWNLKVVCPTCHRRLHYGNVSSKLINDNEWEIRFED